MPLGAFCLNSEGVINLTCHCKIKAIFVCHKTFNTQHRLIHRSLSYTGRKLTKYLRSDEKINKSTIIQ